MVSLLQAWQGSPQRSVLHKKCMIKATHTPDTLSLPKSHTAIKGGHDSHASSFHSGESSPDRFWKNYNPDLPIPTLIWLPKALQSVLALTLYRAWGAPRSKLLPSPLPAPREPESVPPRGVLRSLLLVLLGRPLLVQRLVHLAYYTPTLDHTWSTI